MADQEQYRLFTRRAFILGTTKSVLFLSLISRMYYLQVHSNEHYRVLSDKNRLHTRLIAPERGHIVDQQGIILATQENIYRCLIFKDEVEELDPLIDKLSELIHLTPQEKDHIKQDFKTKQKLIPIKVRDRLSWEEVVILEVHRLDLQGVYVEQGHSRVYPYPFDMCHVIGYVGTVSENDLKSNRLLALPGMKVGKTGIEKTAEDWLQGKAGTQQVEINAHREMIRELNVTTPLHGQDIQLTIDLKLQQHVRNLLSSYLSGAAVVLDVQTGAVKALVSHPSFDANLFAKGINKEAWEQLLKDPLKPLNNKAVSGQYPPGSTIKMLIALTGLEAGVIDPHLEVFCPGSFMLSDHKFHCWKKGGHGPINLERALTQSCDVYFFHLATKLSIDRLSETFKRFGLGEKTNIDLSEEKKGLVPSKTWKHFVFGKNWTLGENLNTCIGQGYVLATPVQLAKMIAMLVNGGKLIQPHLIKQPLPVYDTLLLKKEHINIIIKGMEHVVNDPNGTAYKARIVETGFEMGGKTGTSQVKRITKKERELGTINQGSWEKQDHSLFIGYAPLSNPRYTCCVIVEHGGSGSKVAAPLARDILLFAQKNL
ncbi:MAG: penicillin-binding protein 2 [Proteobacteria bacterium]|nr:penicillin-binding protein 2 [Pseudomonadota bacterium]